MVKDLLLLNKNLWESLFEKLSSIWTFILFCGLVTLDFVSIQIGGFDMFTRLLLQLQIIDLVLGTYASICKKGKHNKEFSSDAGIKGLNKKAMMWAWIWLAHQIDILWGLGVQNVFVKAYCTFEISSIAEIWIALKWYGYATLEKGLMARINSLKKWVTKKVYTDNDE